MTPRVKETPIQVTETYIEVDLGEQRGIVDLNFG